MGPQSEIRPGARLKLPKKKKEAAESASSGGRERTWDSALRDTTPSWSR